MYVCNVCMYVCILYNYTIHWLIMEPQDICLEVSWCRQKKKESWYGKLPGWIKPFEKKQQHQGMDSPSIELMAAGQATCSKWQAYGVVVIPLVYLTAPLLPELTGRYQEWALIKWQSMHQPQVLHMPYYFTSICSPSCRHHFIISPTSITKSYILGQGVKRPHPRALRIRAPQPGRPDLKLGFKLGYCKSSQINYTWMERNNGADSHLGKPAVSPVSPFCEGTARTQNPEWKKRSTALPGKDLRLGPENNEIFWQSLD